MAVSLRAARLDDATWAHALRNQPHVRAASLDQSPIPLEAHLDWWAAALASASRHLHIIQYQGRDAGVVRLDIEGDVAEISIYLRSDLAGQGVGRQAILTVVELARHDYAVRRVDAVIRDENIASQRAFAAAGFIRRQQGWSRAV